ncbi:MAG: thiolase family protein [Glycocaulis sp.]
MDSVYITGVGMTPLGKHLSRTVKNLTREAVTGALADAGLQAHQIEAALFSNTRQPMLEGQNAVRGEIALSPLGIEGIKIVNVENACASGSSAVALGAAMIRAGEAETVLVVGAEKMVFPDRAEQVMAAFRGGTDIERIEETASAMAALGASLIPADAPDAPRSFFMDIYAGIARAHMEAFGTTREQLAMAAAKNHTHAAGNPNAQYRTPFTPENVLADKPVIWPLTRAMCAPVSDGAAALVLQSASAAKANKRAVKLAGTGWTTARARAVDDWDGHLGKRAADLAYEAAGLGPADMHVAEVHDATSFAEILQIENLGLCPRGEGGPFTASGATARGGRIPVNAGGGLIAKGHPVGATGIIQIVETCRQLRGEAGSMQVEGARAGVCENGGGFLGIEEAVTLVTVLTR